MQYTTRISCLYCKETIGFSKSQTKQSFAAKCLKCMPKACCISCGCEVPGALTKCETCLQASEFKPHPGIELNFPGFVRGLGIGYLPGMAPAFSGPFCQTCSPAHFGPCRVSHCPNCGSTDCRTDHYPNNRMGM